MTFEKRSEGRSVNCWGKFQEERTACAEALRQEQPVFEERTGRPVDLDERRIWESGSTQSWHGGQRADQTLRIESLKCDYCHQCRNVGNLNVHQ